MNLKQKVFNLLDEKGYMTDSDFAKFYKKDEPCFWTKQIYTMAWRRLQADREYFKDKKIIKLSYYRRHRQASLDGNLWVRIGKDYFEEILPNFKEDKSRPDLTHSFMYDLLETN